MIKNLIAFYLLLFSATTILAQDDKIYLTSGDTLTGSIDILLPADFFEEITLKTDEGKRRFKSFQMVGFTADNVHYKTIKFGAKYRIMEVIMSGYLGLYRFRTENNYDFGSRFLYKVTNEGIEVPNITFKKSVSEFVSECPSVQAGVKDKTYKSSNVEEMVAAFNNCLGTKPQYAENELKKEKTLKISKELELIKSISANLQEKNINEELSTLLSDVEGKITKGEKVPGYLKAALREATSSYQSVSKDVSDLLILLK